MEFAGAAFRFGHSMIRPSYALNLIIGRTPGKDDSNRIPTFNRDKKQQSNLNGFPGPLPQDWGIDWSFFFDGVGGTRSDDRAKEVPSAAALVPHRCAACQPAA